VALSPGGGLQQIPEGVVNPNLGALNYQDPQANGGHHPEHLRHQKSAGVAWSPKLIKTSTNDSQNMFRGGSLGGSSMVNGPSSPVRFLNAQAQGMDPEGDHGGRINHPGTFAPNIARKLSVDAMSHGSAIGQDSHVDSDIPKFTLNVNVSGSGSNVNAQSNLNQQQLNQANGAQGAAATPLNQVGKSGADFGTDPNS
jgi:hypothetical protein